MQNFVGNHPHLVVSSGQTKSAPEGCAIITIVPLEIGANTVIALSAIPFSEHLSTDGTAAGGAVNIPSSIAGFYKSVQCTAGRVLAYYERF